MKKRGNIIVVLAVCLLGGKISAANTFNYFTEVSSNELIDTLQKEFVNVMFWNVENYFDSFDNPKTQDDEFTPFGQRHWNFKKFVTKRDAIAKTIICAGGENLPVIVGFAEVENRFVMEQLINATPLAKAGYRLVHRDSPDGRGIDVALIYLKNRFKVLNIDFHKVEFENSGETTRLILYVKGVLDLLDTLHLFVNHWPSKLGGELKSLPKRRAAALKLRMACDSVFYKNPKSNIILMGDFNDTPDSAIFSNFEDFINLTRQFFNRGEGTIKFSGKWELIDQIFVSKNLMDHEEPIYCDLSGISIFKDYFLMEKDKEYLGLKPKRIYKGPVYNRGISDHLPVMFKVFK